MRLEPDEQELVDDVVEYGWHVLLVAAGEHEAAEPPFAYTVGLQASFGGPELICFGLPLETMAALLNNAVDELRGGTAPPVAGMVLHDVAEGFACRLSPVAGRHHDEHLGYAIWFARYRREDPARIECLQLLWPDRSGRFPDEEDCSEGVRAIQPVLAR